MHDSHGHKQEFFLVSSSLYLLEKTSQHPAPASFKKRKHTSTHQHLLFFFSHLFCWFLLCFTNPPNQILGGIFPKILPMEDSRKPEVRDLLEFGTPGKIRRGARQDGKMVQLGGWLGWVGLGWVGKNAWCSGCLFSVEVVKLVFSQVALVFLMFEVCFFCCFLVIFFAFVGHFFSNQKKIPEKDDLKFRHQNVGEF